MRTERRCVPRKRPGGISYFEFEAGSGGIVLDASEKGLGFQAANAVHRQGPSRIWISPSPEERIELTGDVVWTDRSKKTGGLRFTETGADSYKKIRNWLGEAGASEESRGLQESRLPTWPAQDLSNVWREMSHDANFSSAPVPRRVKTEVDEERPLELHPIPGLPSLFTSNLPWPSQDSPSSEGRIAYRVATGFLMVVLAVAAVVLFDMFRPKVGDSLIHLGEKINESARLESQSSSPLPNSAGAPTRPSPSSEAKPDAAQTEAKPEVVQKETPGDSTPRLEASTPVNSESPDLAVPSTKEAPRRLPYRRLPNSAEDRSAEATRLWSAVASGDSSAEVDLARLYLRGEGVPRNCEQARVLLRAAAKGGSSEARLALKKLRTRGCW